MTLTFVTSAPARGGFRSHAPLVSPRRPRMVVGVYTPPSPTPSPKSPSPTPGPPVPPEVMPPEPSPPSTPRPNPEKPSPTPSPGPVPEKPSPSPPPSPPPGTSPSLPPLNAAAAAAAVADTDADADIAFVAEPVRELVSVDDYLATLRDHRDSLVVLKVFAPWCRSCRALAPKVNRLAREFASSSVVFVKINYERHKAHCYRLGVTSMPTFILYDGAQGEIDKFSCGPSSAHILREKIHNLVRGYCVLEEDTQNNDADNNTASK